jgi:hypothetical protein
MKILQIESRDAARLKEDIRPLRELDPHLVLVFSSPEFFDNAVIVSLLRDAFAPAVVVGCSTAGEVSMSGVSEKSIVLTAVRFDHARVISSTTDLADMADSGAAGRRLAQSLVSSDLRGVMVFGQGLAINGSALVEGMTDVLGASVPITGGLAGDNGAFTKTFTLGPAGVSDRAIVAVGFIGDVAFGHGSFGGWQPFGPARRVTRCENNVLYELDGEPALEIYKRYLGDYAKDLPASGLLFPFAMLGDDLSAVGLIRTILGVDEKQGSLILAGEIHQGGYLKLMHASTDALVDGAESAARAVGEMSALPAPTLAILVSCVGRKLVMGDRVDEEIEAVASVLGKDAVRTGFYSYGEISPFAPGVSCKLHNQTMTVTLIAER